MALEKLQLLPEQSGYSYTSKNDVIATQLDGGLSRKRKDIARAANEVQCQFVLNPSQYQYFMAFYQAATHRGVTNFLIDLLLEQPYLEEKEAAFVPDSISVENRGLSFSVSVVLEVTASEDVELAEAIMLLYDPKGANSTLLSLEQLVNYDLDVS